MTNYTRRSPTFTPRPGYPLLGFVCLLALAGCEKPSEQPSSPQEPPKPKVMTEIISPEVKRAVFTYSSKPAVQFQDGRGTAIERHVIQT